MGASEQNGGPEGYEPFFGLHEPPFSLAPDPRFLFESASHSAALGQVTYALQRREPLVVITGEIGTGKTLLCRTVLKRLQRKTFLSIIDDPLLDRDDLVKQLLEDFGVISKDRKSVTDVNRHELVQALHDFLRSLASIHAHAVVIVDEAQHLHPAVLEQMRLISNIDDERGTLLQIILVGQTDLEALLLRPELSQLHQRVSRRVRLAPLTREEVQQYIEHRIGLARDGVPASGAPGAAELARALADWGGAAAGVEFTSDAVQAVYRLSHGLPRTINLLCDRSLEEACRADRRVIDHRVVDAAAGALGIGDPAAPRSAPDGLPPRTDRPNAAADAPFWTPLTIDPVTPAKAGDSGSGSEPFHDVFNPPAASKPSSLRTRYVVGAAVLAVAGVAAWFGVRGARPAVSIAPAPPPSATEPSTAQPEPQAAAPADVPPPAPAGTGGAPQIDASPAAPPAPRTSERFDLVVASFRTDARAAALSEEVTALGLPNRRRVSDGWQQVICGPFASRAEAEQAQQRLDAAGLSGSQIVSIQ